MTPRNLLNSLLITAFCLSILVYLSYQLFRPKGNDIETEVAEYVLQNDVAEVTGYIFRNETVLYNTFQGYISYQVSDRQKLSIGDLVASVYSNAANTGVKSQIDEINKKISVLERSTLDTSYASTSTDRIDADIHKLYIELLEGVARKNANRVLINRDEILIQLNRRQMLTHAVESFQPQINYLTSQRDALSGTFNSAMGSYIYSPAAGTFYTGVDGFESTFTPEKLETITLDEYKELLKSQPNKAILDKSVGKLATDYEWYIACEIDRADAPYFDVGKEYNLMFPYSGDAKIKSVLERKLVQITSDTVLLTFRTLMAPAYFDFTRKQAVKIVLWELSGLKVPHSALRVVDNHLGVFVLKGNKVEFKLIKEEDKLWESYNYYIIAEGSPKDDDTEEEKSYSRLKLYDQIVTSGKDLFNGMIIN